MLLCSIVGQLLKEVALSKVTAGQYSRCVDRLSTFLGRPATLDDLNSDTAND